MAKHMRLADFLDYLRLVGEVVALFFGKLSRLVASGPFNAQAAIARISALNQTQDRAMAGRVPATLEAHGKLQEALDLAKWFVWMAKGYFATHGRLDLVDAFPTLVGRRNYDSLVAYLEAILKVLDDHPEVLGVDRERLRSEIATVKAMKGIASVVRIASVSSTGVLNEEEDHLLEEAVGWIDIFRGIAKITHDPDMMAKIPTLPSVRTHRKEVAGNGPSTPAAPSVSGAHTTEPPSTKV